MTNLASGTYRQNNINGITSLEVAEMVGREHRNVTRDIKDIIKDLGVLNVEQTPYFEESTYTHEQNMQVYPMFILTKLGCELYGNRMTGIDGTAFSIKYIERFNEMEKSLQPKLPTNYKEALLALVAAEEEKERLAETLHIQAPKVEYFEKMSERNNSITLRDTAKLLGLRPNRFNVWLRENHYLYYSKKKMIPYQNHKRKYFDVKEDQYGLQVTVNFEGRTHFASIVDKIKQENL